MEKVGVEEIGRREERKKRSINSSSINGTLKAFTTESLLKMCRKSNKHIF